LFLGALGVTALSAYSGCWLVNFGWAPSLVLIVVCAGTVVLTIGLGQLLASSSGLVYAVFTFAFQLSVIKLAGVQNRLTNGDSGVVSPFWSIAKSSRSYDYFTLTVAVGSVLISIGLYELMKRKRSFTYSQLFAESPLLTTSLGVYPLRATLPTHALAGLVLGFAALVCVFRFQLIQPSIFSPSTALVTLVIGFLVPKSQSWLLLVYGVILVTLRVTIQAWSLEEATQLSAVIAGVVTLLAVLRIWRIHLFPLKQPNSGKPVE
jgi:ABC-type branched-subunit amino acid transport system permease subunit